MVWIEALLVAFGTILVAELADKTQLVTISQACRYSTGPVIAGSSLALIMVTALGVVGGTLLHEFLDPVIVGLLAGILFIAFAVLLLLRWRKDQREAAECAEEGDSGEEEGQESNWRAFGSTFGLVAVAEMGDKTQLAVIALAGRFGAPVAVFTGASLALVLVSCAGVLGGRLLARRLSAGRLELVAATLFLVLGLAFIAIAAIGL
jgi:putative Ca2+/H+ antiporter (TMEM165/GDT1 family)